MKKTYQTPEIRVIELAMEGDVLGMTYSNGETNRALSTSGGDWSEDSWEEDE